MLSKETSEYISTLTEEFIQNADPLLAQKQEAYLRNQFKCFGITTQQRRTIQKPFLHKTTLPSRKELHDILYTLWNKKEREYHYFAQELLLKYLKTTGKEDIILYEHMITHNSWWDTVDLIANKLVGNYFILFPSEKEEHIDKWLCSNNIWLQRTTLLFQLKYKEKLDKTILTACIHHLLGSNEFFINKAIGWVLREYSRTNPTWVETFVSTTKLNALSEREALRLLD